MKALHISDIDWDVTQAVIFDLDGTIYDKPHLALHLALNEMSVLPFLLRERHAYKQMKGCCYNSRDQFYEAFFKQMARGGHLISARTARNWYMNDYMPLMCEALCFFYHAEQWALDIVDYCNRNSVPVCVVSDYPFVDDKLQALHIDPKWFTFTSCTHDFGGLKPNQRVMEQVVARIGVPAKNCLMIGDRDDTDGAFARSVGARFLKC